MLKARTLALFILALAVSISACKKGPTQEQLFEKAKKFQEESNFQGAIESYQEIVKRFPKSTQAPQCQFMIGYLYANHMKNMEMAKDAYRTFIRNYPEHELVKDAQWELDHLGKDVNEIEELNKILGRDSGAVKSDTAS
ncbi:outer membrane protein assembly factor BamD [candidate division KSB1 bacterium]|nr:MAG: outer membrane protein assembly factor BamD [candidate division KSB1 bacterium]